MKIPSRSLSSKAFTLIELLAVLAILAIIAGFAAPAIFKQINKGKVDAAKANIGTIENSLNQFYLDCGFFPKSPEPGLSALVTPPSVGRQCKDYSEGGYFKKGKLPLDPWNQEYFYLFPGEHNAQGFDLFSAGQDGESNTDDDVTNW